MAIDAAGRPDAVHCSCEVWTAGDQTPGHKPLAHDLARVVNVIDEVVERPDALGQAALDGAPFLSAEHSGDEVEGEGSFMRSATLPARLESDALLHEDRITTTACLHETLRTESPKLGHKRLGRRAGRAVKLKQLVTKRSARPVVPSLKRVGHGAHRRILAPYEPDRLRRLEQVWGARVRVCSNAAFRSRSGRDKGAGATPNLDYAVQVVG